MKLVTRRQALISSGATAFTAGLMPHISLAQTTVGDARITSVSDGALTLPKNMIFDAVSPADYEPILSAYGVAGDMLTPPCNVTLLESGDRKVLFDLGAGPEFMASAGQLLDSLAAIDVDPGDITDVVFTHAHPDHIWGLLDDFGDRMCPNATYMIGQDEWDYWINPNTIDTIDEARKTFAIGAERRLREIEEQISFFHDGDEIMPGVAARATFGHTPGHMAIEVRSGTDAVMIIGDAIGNHHVAFERPDWFTGSDQDQEMGAATRVSLLDQLAQEQTRIIGFHLEGNGVGHVERKDSGYRFVPDGA